MMTVVIMPIIAASTAVVAAVLTQSQVVIVAVRLDVMRVHVVVVVVVVVVCVAKKDRVLITGRRCMAVMFVARGFIARCRLLLDHMRCCMLGHHRLQPGVLSSLNLCLLTPHGCFSCSNSILLVVQLLLAACQSQLPL